MIRPLSGPYTIFVYRLLYAANHSFTIYICVYKMYNNCFFIADIIVSLNKCNMLYCLLVATKYQL